MGALRNISSGPPRRRAVAPRAGLAALVWLLLIAGGIAAADDSPPPEEPIEAPAELTTPTVEASAQSVAGTAWRPNTSAPVDATPARPTAPPLTRAAARKQIEEMSPMTWLEGFGRVTVGHTE